MSKNLSEYWPFDPQHPANPNVFVGRKDGIQTVTELCIDSLSGKTNIAHIVGERGIGKTSLAKKCRQIIQDSGNCIGFHIYLRGNKGIDSEQEFYKATINQIKDEAEWGEKKFFTKAIEFISKYIKITVPLNGVDIEFSNSQPSEKTTKPIPTNLSEFFSFICDFSHHIFHDQNDGVILLIFDELGKVSEEDFFAQLLKELVDKNSTNICNHVNLLILLCSSSISYENIIRKNDSIGRMISLIKIGPLNIDEERYFYVESFNKTEYTISDKEVQTLMDFSQGKPRLMHLLGWCTIHVLKNEKLSKIDKRVIKKSVNLAAEKLGLEIDIDNNLQNIKSLTEYTPIIKRLVSIDIDLEFSKNTMLSGLDEKSKMYLDDFLDSLVKLRFVDHGPMKKSYRFPNRLLSLHVHNIFDKD